MTFQIITPGRFVEPIDPIGLNAEVEGYFTLQAVRHGRVVRSTRFKNLITDVGLNRLGDNQANSVYGRFNLGVGTAQPQVTDTQLQSPVGTISAGGNAQLSSGGAPDWYTVRSITATSTIGALGNNNLTEIGMGPSTGSANRNLWSRALILDSAGNPTAFPISEDEQLIATYEIWLYPPLEDFVTEVDVSGLRECTVRALAVNMTPRWGMQSQSVINTDVSPASGSFHTGGLGAITDELPGGTYIAAGAGTSLPYVNGSLSRTLRYSWAPTQAVSDSLTTHVAGTRMAHFQVQYDPPLQKTNEQTMYLEYEFGWDRR